MNVVAAAVAFLFGAWLLYRALPQTAKAASPEYETKEWARSALPLLIFGNKKEALYYPIDQHWNPRGQEVAAHLIARWLSHSPLINDQ